MANDFNNTSILSQLDDSEKSDIITQEELEEIGVAYGSKEKYEQAMRTLAEHLSGAPLGRSFVSVGVGKTSPRIREGTSTVSLGDLPKLKKINIHDNFFPKVCV